MFEYNKSTFFLYSKMYDIFNFILINCNKNIQQSKNMNIINYAKNNKVYNSQRRF